MDDDDDVFLKSLNNKDASTCSEDHFEEVVNFYEQTAQTKQPYAAVDNSPVLTYEAIRDAFDESLDAPTRLFDKEIYEHWKARRLKTGNRSLTANLKVGAHRDMCLRKLMTYCEARDWCGNRRSRSVCVFPQKRSPASAKNPR